MKNRTLIGIGCIAMAFLVFFVALPMTLKDSGEKVTLLRAKNRISRGSLITDADIESYTSSEKREGEISDSALVAGMYALCDIFPGDGFTSDKIGETSDSAAEVLCRLEDGKLAITVPVGTFSAGFSGQLENGDIVKIFFTGAEAAEAPAELEYVRVIGSVSAEGASLDGTQAGGDARTLPVSVMLEVNEKQAALLAAHSVDNSIYFVFVCHSDASAAGTYLEKQEAYFRDDENNGDSEDKTGIGGSEDNIGAGSSVLSGN